MKTAGLGRRFGDWLGLVPDDDVAVSASPVIFDDTDATADPEPGSEPAREDPVVQIARAAPPPPRARRFVPTPEFDAELIAFRDAVDELRAGLEADA